MPYSCSGDMRRAVGWVPHPPLWTAWCTRGLSTAMATPWMRPRGSCAGYETGNSLTPFTRRWGQRGVRGVPGPLRLCPVC